MRGDPPCIDYCAACEFWSTPHARGSTLILWSMERTEPVYPACAGIHRCQSNGTVVPTCLPRMRGDPPRYKFHQNYLFQSTPHARGSTWIEEEYGETRKVYPACAGIHPKAGTLNLKVDGLPRMRGDPPDLLGPGGPILQSTPHARGSTA